MHMCTGVLDGTWFSLRFDVASGYGCYNSCTKLTPSGPSVHVVFACTAHTSVVRNQKGYKHPNYRLVVDARADVTIHLVYFVCAAAYSGA